MFSRIDEVRHFRRLLILQDGRWIPTGNPIKAAIDAFARRLGINTPAEDAALTVSRRFPFDPRRKRMSVYIAGKLITKAPLIECFPSVNQHKAQQKP